MVRAGAPNQQNPMPLAFPKSDIAQDRRPDETVLSLINGSGAAVPIGSVVAFDTSVTTEVTFTTVTDQAGSYIYGVTLEDIAAGALGKVQVLGVVETRTAAGTGLYRWVEPSSTAGVAQGTTAPTDASFGITVGTRDTNTGRQIVILSNVAAVTQHNTIIYNTYNTYSSSSSPPTPSDATTLNIFLSSNDGKLRVMKVGGVSKSLEDEYGDIMAPGAAQRTNWWDDFHGLVATSGTTLERYVVAGTANTGFNNDTTTGRVYFLTTDATAAGSLGRLSLRGGQFRANEKWWAKFLSLQNTAPVGGTQEYLFGFFETAPAGTQVDGIYFRSVDAANWFLVCRDAGVESTVDMGVAPTSTLILLEFRINSTTSVSAYYNDALIGTITTNIPTNLMTIFMVANHVRTAISTTTGRLACFGWGLEGAMQ